MLHRLWYARQPGSNPCRSRVHCALWAALAGVGLLSLLVSPPLTSATSLAITVNTSTLAGTDAQVEFLLLDGDFISNNQATITCLAPCLGAPSATITDPLGQYLQDVLPLGNQLVFTLDLTPNFDPGTGGTPDRLILSLLDPSTSFTLVQTNLNQPNDPVPYQNALVVIDLLGGDVNIQTASLTNPALDIQVVPEPGTAALMLLGLPLLAWCLVRRHRTA